MEKTIIGRIDCPTCGHAQGMRVTHDKNKDPFGFCDEGCGQQLRIGGNPARVRAFVARFPWAAKPGTATAVTAVQMGEKVEIASVTVTEEKPAPAPKKRNAFDDALTILGGISK